MSEALNTLHSEETGKGAAKCVAFGNRVWGFFTFFFFSFVFFIIVIF